MRFWVMAILPELREAIEWNLRQTFHEGATVGLNPPLKISFPLADSPPQAHWRTLIEQADDDSLEAQIKVVTKVVEAILWDNLNDEVEYVPIDGDAEFQIVQMKENIWFIKTLVTKKFNHA